MMRFILLPVLLVSFLLAFPFSSPHAHPGRKDLSGCHTCRTNCAKWGLSQGEYHCHGGLVKQDIPQPTQKPAFAPKKKSTSYTCNCRKTCSNMTCAEAYFQLNTCGCGARDGDNDGIPCENVCG